jgi:hypothetical protein
MGADAGLELFKEKLNGLIAKEFPKGEVDGVAAWERLPGQYGIFWTFTPEGADDERLVEVHIYPNKNPRSIYDEAKETSLKPDSWDQIVGWVDGPSESKRL